MPSACLGCLLQLILAATVIGVPLSAPTVTLKILSDDNSTLPDVTKWLIRLKEKEIFPDSFPIPTGCENGDSACMERTIAEDLESINIFPGDNSVESDEIENESENSLDGSKLLQSVLSQSELQEVMEDADINSTRQGRAIGGLLKHAFSFMELKQAISELETSVMTSVSCTACKAGVGLLQHYIATQRSVKDITHAAVKVCVSLKIETPRVCQGIISSLAGEVVYVLQHVALSPEEACGLLLGDTCAHPVNPFHSWLVQLPPVPKPTPPPPSPSPRKPGPVTKVLHISDTHFDPHYQPGSNAVCGEPLCCRESSGVPSSAANRAGLWGDYRKCDTPRRTIESLLDHVAAEHSDLSYIIWTGDLPPHDVWNQSKSYNLKIIRETVAQLVSRFPNTPIYPALGNHESVPVNSFPPPFTPERYSIDWLYEELNRQWGRWLPLSTSPTIRRGAFYSVLVSPKFRIISVNTNYCNNKNWWLILNSTDPASELQWLVYELQAAEFNQEKVHIIGHIPPGYADCLRVWSYNYYRIVNRYESTIAAQFFGHTHYDEFELFYDLKNPTRPVSIAYVGPSISPYYGLNPGYRIYEVDGDYPGSSKMVLDHETWVLDLVSANKYDMADWYKLYSAKALYKMPSTTPDDWDALVRRMLADDELFYTYYRLHWKNSAAREPCGQQCKMRLLCNLVSGRSHDRQTTCKHLNDLSKEEGANRRSWTSVLFNGLATVYVTSFVSGFSWLSTTFGAVLASN